MIKKVFNKTKNEIKEMFIVGSKWDVYCQAKFYDGQVTVNRVSEKSCWLKNLGLRTYRESWNTVTDLFNLNIYRPIE